MMKKIFTVFAVFCFLFVPVCLVHASEENVSVTVTAKENIEMDYMKGIYSPRVNFTLEVENQAGKSVKGIQGVLEIKDMFGVKIMRATCDLTGQVIPPGDTAVYTGIGIEINQFMSNHQKLYDTSYEDLIFSYEISQVVYAETNVNSAANGASEQGNAEGTPEQAASEEEIRVTCTDKISEAADYMAGKYSPRVNFVFSVENNTSQEVRGIKGVLTINDLFGGKILAMNCDFTGKTIAPGETVIFDGLGLEINEFMSDHTKLYNEKYEDLQFSYEIKEVISADSNKGSANSITTGSEDVNVVCTAKENLPVNYNAGRYSPYVKLVFEVENKSGQAIRGIQGKITIKDLFGDKIISGGCDFTGHVIQSGEKVVFDNMSFEINQFMSEHVKLYNEEYQDLQFEYEVTDIVFAPTT